jgi:equilibrative nucleoside transporter 1/2/3
MRVIWPVWLADALNFMITLTIFPGYVSELPQNKPWCTWTPVVVTAVFCACDWIGRHAATKVTWPSEKWAWVPVYFRIVFFPIFLLSLQNVIDLGEPYWTFLWMVPFAITNGSIGTRTVVVASGHSKLDPEEKKIGGFLMTLAINLGILAAMGLTYALPQATLPTKSDCSTD